MHRLSLLRFGTYAALLAALLIARPRYFIEFENFPFMKEKFDWWEHFDEELETSEEKWMREYSKRTGGFNHFHAELIARDALIARGVDGLLLSHAFVPFQRGEHGAYLVSYPAPVTVDGRELLCIRIGEDRVPKLYFVKE